MNFKVVIAILTFCVIACIAVHVRVGHEAPSFKADAIVGHQITTFNTEDYKGKWLILLFYPLDFTFVCPTEITAFSDRHKEFEELNSYVAGISVDSKYSHLAWVKTPRHEGGVGALNIPLISDITKEIARSYDVLIEEGNDSGVTLRGLFIINQNGIVRQITINDLPVGRSVDETLRLIRAFQYTDIHGEVCPANWQPGAATMKPDPEGCKEYFGKIQDS